MKLVVEKTERLEGTVHAPPSKSHTHRVITIASLACGESVIKNPLLCDDVNATIGACKSFGADITGHDGLRIIGVDGEPKRSDSDVHVGNSGTTMRFMTAAFALCKGATTLSGDGSVRARPMAPLLKSLTDLGATRAKALNKDGCPPVCVGGKMTGGSTAIEGESSQFVSALLLACPLAGNDSMIEVKEMRSKPYVGMTLEHLERAGARVWSADMQKFFIPGGQCYKNTQYAVPGDYSSAAFLMAAAEITGSEIEITGLDADDTQGDRAMTGIMEEMRSEKDREIDLGDNPDLLPILAVLGCHAEGKTVLKNVSHARKKESDRISAICSELRKMGAAIGEMPDGLVVQKSKLRGTELEGHGDHRIVMALAVAALAAEGRSIINGADTISKSYPRFVEDLAGLGASIRKVDR